jgi:hypothetical protein
MLGTAPKGEKQHPCRFSPAQGIEAEIPEAPGRSLPGAEELERIARFFAARRRRKAAKNAPKELRKK